MVYLVTLKRSLHSSECLKLLIMFFFTLRKRVCCFVLDILMTFTAAFVTSVCADPVYMVLINVCRIFICLLFCRGIAYVFTQGVELNVSEICKKCVH